MRQVGTEADAFLDFEKQRIEKANFVVKTSLQIGQLCNIGGAFGYRLRNLLMSSVPKSMGEKQFDYLFRVDY